MAFMPRRREDGLHGMAARRTLLLTSFGAFPGAPVNPSEAVAALADRLAGRRLERIGIRLVAARLPVVFAAVGAEIARLHARHAPIGALHLGLASSRKTMTPEARAGNRLTLRHPDASGACSASASVQAGGASLLSSTLSAARLTRVLRGCGIAARPSRSAGSYVCNQALYLSLLKGVGPVGFIHLPQPCAALTARRMAAGVAACLMEMAKLTRKL